MLTAELESDGCKILVTMERERLKMKLVEESAFRTYYLGFRLLKVLYF